MHTRTHAQTTASVSIYMVISLLCDDINGGFTAMQDYLDSSEYTDSHMIQY